MEGKTFGRENSKALINERTYVCELGWLKGELQSPEDNSELLDGITMLTYPSIKLNQP